MSSLEGFTSLLAEIKKIRADLAAAKYCVLLKGDGFKVRKYELESDYSADVEETFEKFKTRGRKRLQSRISRCPR